MRAGNIRGSNPSYRSWVCIHRPDPWVWIFSLRPELIMWFIYQDSSYDNNIVYTKNTSPTSCLEWYTNYKLLVDYAIDSDRVKWFLLWVVTSPTRTYHAMSLGQGLKESDSRVGPKHTDSTRGLSSKIRDSKFFRAAHGLSLLTQPVAPGRRGRTQTRPVATLDLSNDWGDLVKTRRCFCI